MSKIYFTLNGKRVAFDGDPLKRLVDVLREGFQLTAPRRAVERESAEPAPYSGMADLSPPA